MKIFNWLHCKLHNSSSYSQVSTEPKVVSEIKLLNEAGLERDTDKLLLHDILNEILTIGTLGHNHPLLSQAISVEHELVEVKEDLKEKESVMVANHQELPVIELVKLNEPIEEENKVEIAEKDEHEEDTKSQLPLLKEDKEKGVKRTTLADLFAAEALLENEEFLKESEMDNFKGKQHQKYCKIEVQYSKGKAQKSSKPIVEAAKTTKKLQKLMMKMLRKKVHPMMAATKGEMLKEKNNSVKLLNTAQLVSDVDTAISVLPLQPMEIRGY